MRVLLFGGNGQIGTELQRSLAPLGEVVVATRNGRLVSGAPCESADFAELTVLPALIARVAPDVVVNAAAYTAVEAAEDDAEAAFRVNARAPGAIADACAMRNLLMVHYSTDYVFDGTAARPYREDDPTSPVNVYGASKLAGERAIRSSGARHLILRTAWVYGAHGGNFLTTILRLAKERDELRVVDDQVGTPTSAAFVANATATIVSQHPAASGTWHLVPDGCASWHGFAEAIVLAACERGLLDHPVSVVPVSSAAHPLRARRPAFSCLDNHGLQAGFGLSMSPWQDYLAAEMDDLASAAS